MKKTAIMAALCAGVLAAGAARLAASGVQDSVLRAITQAECGWARAYVARDSVGIHRFEADEFTGVYPDGSMGNKWSDIAAITSGRVRITSFRPLDVHVRRYRNVVVATGHSAIEGTAQGREIDGVYAWTDTWVLRHGRWQALAAQATRVMGQAPSAPARDICTA